ncbi:GNAT family N-acetyltransferase [Aidingimonas lacisalsi]|uniref:GNAT family N-acetyltransferase n=1 Tax=Aidingimonas lacisalsi TaxID=2604086 RepID=UPI0011D1E330|nr:N-acetyltransferase [Aidingimonas lacisalsi]
MNLTVRNATPGDADRIVTVIESAFQAVPHSDHTEQFIVNALQEAGALSVSLAAAVDRVIIGHVALSPVHISDGTTEWYGVGPVSVLPDYQGKGAGSRLMKRALNDIKTQGASGCVVLGDPDYYGRFGFQAVEGLVFPGVPAEYFQALSFGNGFPQGEVTYHRAFYAHG